MSKTRFSSLNSLGRKFFYLILLFIFIGLGKNAFSPDTKVSGQSTPQSCPTCQPPTEQTIYAPLIELNGLPNTEININCRSSHPIDVVPTFYTDEGTPFTGETIRLAPAEMRFVSIRQLIPGQHLNQHKWGGVALSYTGNLMEVWAQLTVREVGSQGSANTLFTVVDARRSNTQQAVWLMPKNATATLAMGNYSDTPAGAILTFSNGDIEQVYLAPYATKVISRKNNGQNSTGIDAESVRIEANGQIGRLITTGVIVSNDRRYASSLRFYDRENTFQSNLYSTNFRLKNSTPSIVLKNTTTDTITARPRFLPKTGDGGGVVELPAVTLLPNAVRELNLTALVNAAATRADLNSVAVQIINSGEKGSLIGAANFTDNVTGVDYDIPLRDSGSPARAAGGYPIRLDGDYSTILSLTNAGNAVGKFTLQINYAGGVYALYPQEVAPGATAFFDFRQLRDQRTPDSSGRVLPVDFTVGQIRWSMVGGTATTLIGRSEIVSKSDKVSSSYSCGVCCLNSYSSSRLVSDQIFAFVGDTPQVTAKQTDGDCYSNILSEYTVSNPTWSSNDLSVVTIDYYGVTNAVAVGETMITANWETYGYILANFSECEQYTVPANATGQMTVSPKIDSISPNFAAPGATRTVTINGTGFIAFSTSVESAVSNSPLVIRNLNFISSQQIRVSIAVDSNAFAGVVPIRVVSNNMTSNTRDFEI